MVTLLERSWAKHLRPVAAEHLAGDKVRPENPLFGLLWINGRRLGGTPCFYGTRVPIKNLFDYLESGHTVDAFLKDFDGVSREQATGVLELARLGLLADQGRP